MKGRGCDPNPGRHGVLGTLVLARPWAGGTYSDSVGCLVSKSPLWTFSGAAFGGGVRTVSVNSPHPDPEISLFRRPPGTRWQWEASDSSGRCFLCRPSSFLYKWIKFWTQWGCLLSWYLGLALPSDCCDVLWVYGLSPQIQTLGS